MSEGAGPSDLGQQADNSTPAAVASPDSRIAPVGDGGPDEGDEPVDDVSDDDDEAGVGDADARRDDWSNRLRKRKLEEVQKSKNRIVTPAKRAKKPRVRRLDMLQAGEVLMDEVDPEWRGWSSERKST